MKLTEDLKHRLWMRPYIQIVHRAGADLPDLPSVWDSARKMFADLMGRVGSTASMAKRRMRQVDRFELMLWLKPVEDLVRSWLITRAVTWLLMSDAGRKLIRDKLEKLRRRPHKITIPYPGWHTIARHWRPEPEPEPQAAPAEAEPRDRTNPRNWKARFQALVLDTHTRSSSKATAHAMAAVAGTRTDISTARRIEMLARVIAKPELAIRRIARQIARLPLDALKTAREEYFKSVRLWMHGRQEFMDARVHERCAINVFYRAIEAG